GGAYGHTGAQDLVDQGKNQQGHDDSTGRRQRERLEYIFQKKLEAVLGPAAARSKTAQRSRIRYREHNAHAQIGGRRRAVGDGHHSLYVSVTLQLTAAREA